MGGEKVVGTNNDRRVKREGKRKGKGINIHPTCATLQFFSRGSVYVAI